VIPLRYIPALLLAAAAASAGGAELTTKQPAGPYVVELTVSPKAQVTETAMVFAVTDGNGKPVDTAKARGFANFSSGKLKGRATLRPDGVNRMKGYGLMSAKPDLSIEVSIALPDAPPLEAAFKPLQ
jgi:hypothetical protein